MDDTESESDCDAFFFESDHLALRGNSDYIAVLRTIAVLQAQRIQGAHEIDELSLAERNALEDPDEFLEKLKKGIDLNIPGPMNVLELPKIDLVKYKASMPIFTEQSANESQKNSTNTSRVNDVTVRGRVFDQTKPETFNQLWTCEEQQRLEELLVEFPPEQVEMQRFAKIARALGNRTTKQVASRVQKFFKKLHAAGMPIPGRQPKSQQRYLPKNFRWYKQVLRPSTFFPAQDVPVTMPEDDDAETSNLGDVYCHTVSGANSVTGSLYDNALLTVCIDEDSDGDGVQNESGRRLRLLQRVRDDKRLDMSEERSISEHDGYQCELCCEDPIIGTRWHCATCTHASIDFCSDCMVTQLCDTRKAHTIHHRIAALRVNANGPSRSDTGDTDPDDCVVEDENDDEPQRGSNDDDDDDHDIDADGMSLMTNVYDKDYRVEKFQKARGSGYNYMDPNYLPE